MKDVDAEVRKELKALALFEQEKVVMPQSLKYVFINDEAKGIAKILTDKAYISTYIMIVLFIFLSIWVYKSQIGFRMRACGENPEAADSAGINVALMRYIGTTISGLLAGCGGYIYIATTAGGTAESTVAGMGYLALAIMIFGNWNPLTIGLGALLFGFLKCVGPLAGQKGFFLEPLHIPTLVYNMIPYIIVLVVLVVARKRNGCPKAEGIPYDKGMR